MAYRRSRARLYRSLAGAASALILCGVAVFYSRSPFRRLTAKPAEDADMGELLDALNTLDAGGAAPQEPKSTVDQAAKAFQSASRRVGEAVDAARQPDMPLDVLTRLVRQVPLQSLAIAFAARCDDG